VSISFSLLNLLPRAYSTFIRSILDLEAFNELSLRLAAGRVHSGFFTLTTMPYGSTRLDIKGELEYAEV
jgi:hypothetical protein